MIIVLDLTLCQADGGRKYHGGGEYGKYAALFILKNVGSSAIVYVRDEVPAELKGFEGISGNEFRIVPANIPFVLPKELDRTDVRLFLPIPYDYLKKNQPPENARLWVSIHGLRELDILNLRVQGVRIAPLSDPFLVRDAMNCLTDSIWRRRYKRRLKNKSLEYEKAFSKLKETDTILVLSKYTEWGLKRFFNGRLVSRIIRVGPLSPFLNPVGDLANIENSTNSECRSGILMVGAERPEKNVTRVFEAIRSSPALMEILSSERVVVTGDGRYLSVLPDRIGGRVPLFKVPYCDAKKLIELYRDSRVFVYPSLNEGYGIPPLEAMRVGTPVLASPSTSVSEVLGDAATYANPVDTVEIANRLYQLLESPDHWNDSRERGFNKFCEIQSEVLLQWREFCRGSH